MLGRWNVSNISQTRVSFPLSICTWFLNISISQNWFLNMIFELDFLSISNLIFAGHTGTKNQVWNKQIIKLKNKFCEIEILKKIKYSYVGGKFWLVCCHCGLIKRSVEGQNFHCSSIQWEARRNLNAFSFVC